MKKLLLAVSLLLPMPAASAFAQAPNDIAAKLSDGKAYTEGKRANRRAARAVRAHARPAPAPSTAH